MITILKSKIRELKIEVCNPECEGSITIPAELMQRAGILPWERVEVNSKNHKGRISTYAISGERAELNGGAANHFEEGEIVHVNAFRSIPEECTKGHRPIII